MTKNFRNCVEIILSHEGGYVDHPNDPGGETKYGISKRAYPNEDIKNLTKDRAIDIYKRDYWDKVRGDSLPVGVALCVFDMAVNAGVSRAIKMLQRCVNVKDDGVIGPMTIAAANAWDKHETIERFTTARILYYTGLNTWGTFGAGWTRRCIETHTTAIQIREE